MSDAGRPSTPKRYAIVISLLIAPVSIISAVVAYRAAFWSATAGDMGGQALQEVLETQQIEDDLRTSVDADTRLMGRYDAAWKRTSQLQSQAADLRSTDPDTAAELDIEAQGEYGQPVRLFTSGYGDDADTDVLKQLAEATNGSAYTASDPTTINKVFTQVVSNF